MWLLNNILIPAISMSMLAWSPKYEDNHLNNQWHSEDIENVVPKKESMLAGDDLPSIQKWIEKQISICLTTDSENSFTHTIALEGVSNPQNTILEYPLEQLFQRYWNRPHPLRVSWVGKNFEALLWKNWIERLLSNTPQKLGSRQGEITSDTKYEIDDTLRFPLINPLLKDDFPQYLSDQLKEEWFENFSDSNADKILGKSDSNNDNKKSDFIYDIVVKRAPSWKSALALYRNGKLLMATYVSVWLNSRKTKTWQFRILGKEPYKRSFKYDNAAMPEALSIGDGFYFHQWRVTWNNLSHGCIRIPGVFADVLYSLVKDHIDTTDAFISKNLYK